MRHISVQNREDRPMAANVACSSWRGTLLRALGRAEARPSGRVRAFAFLRNSLSVSVAAFFFLAAGCARENGETAAEERVITVETAPVIQREWQIVARAVGNLVADEQVVIRNEVSGIIRRIEAQEGDGVEEGDVLLRLDDEKLRLEVTRAEARYDHARATLIRRRPLFEQELISEAELIESESNYKSAEAELELARRRLEDATVRAPISGILGRRYMSPGDFAPVGAQFFDLVKMDVLKLDFDLPESYLPTLRTGQAVRVRTPAYPEENFEGEVYFVDPVVRAETRTVRLRGLVDNADMLLRPNMFVTAELDLTTMEDALVIPEAAVIGTLDGYRVFIVDEDHVAQRRDIELGEREPGWLQVRAGLQTGDIVVTAGHQRLYPGLRVRDRREDGETTHTDEAP